MVVELARLHANLVGAVAKGKLSEFGLKIEIAPDGTLGCDYQQLFILRPADPFDGGLVPGDGPDRFSSAAVDVYAGFDDGSGLEGEELIGVPIQG